jgi:hypothetical protein
MENPLRQVWITETAQTTALNTAYFAESVATFAIVMGVALLLTGIGFLVLTLRVLRRVAGLRPRDRVAGQPALGRVAVR